jgi:hypothetical protein
LTMKIATNAAAKRKDLTMVFMGGPGRQTERSAARFATRHPENSLPARSRSRYRARVLGWLADLFRLVWGLVYWNLRKSWFRLRRGRARCPCQSLSDSGRAFETGCDASLPWNKPVRFRRVCPLLVETPDGLRCSANTADVRPFWGRTLRYFGGTLATVYLAGALSVFVFLRIVGYPVNIVHVTWPGLWYRVPQARGWFFFERSNRAFAAGKTAEGLLYLSNAYEFDPTNYVVGLTLAKNYQAANPRVSDQVFARLVHDHPAERDSTIWEWFRALLARGNFESIARLAHDQTLADPTHAHAWMRALLFATRQIGDDAPLRTLLADPSPAAAAWHQLLETELLVRAGRTRDARDALLRRWPPNASPFTLYYRVSTLTTLGETLDAIDLLLRSQTKLDDEASTTLKLDAYAAAGMKRLLQGQIDSLLSQKLDLPRIKILCAHLIRWPDAETFARLYDNVDRSHLALNTESAGVWFSLLCTAGVVGDRERLQTLVATLTQATKTQFLALTAVEAFFRSGNSAERITTLLPVLPLPLEVDYALIERYPGRRSTPAAPALKP